MQKNNKNCNIVSIVFLSPGLGSAPMSTNYAWVKMLQYYDQDFIQLMSVYY